MKKKTLISKLTLHKKTIAELQQNVITGGGDWTTIGCQTRVRTICDCPGATSNRPNTSCPVQTRFIDCLTDIRDRC
ncbi:MAG TPA: class I lanthipeptide [Chitinophaga sp.]|uniref:class I lanthipeptide n=1 Tax=Chitinophaga sp. TaxID=1869181 RepID=UPI002C8B4F38|nr:class I lanthipeptide [Chitinophaga sp.]HVI45447.1 class I lanthipeptide [Chitinophaga sp.]